MGIEINYGKSAFCLPRDTLISKLSGASETDLKLLLLLSSNDQYLKEYPDCIEALAQACSVEEKDVELSVSFWRGAGIFTLSKSSKSKQEKAKAEEKSVEKKPIAEQEKTNVLLPADELPQYSGQEIQTIMENDGGELSLLINECQEILGKIFNPHEVNIIVGLSDYLKLENEHIMMLCEYCRAKGKSSVHYIEKSAFQMYNDGIDSLEKLDNFIKQEEMFKTYSESVRSIIGIYGRASTSNENRSFALWNEWNMNLDLIKRAYEITIENTGKYNISYMHKILTNWHGNGYTQISEIEKADADYKKKSAGFDVGSGFDTDEFFNAAIKRSYDEENSKDGGKP